MTDAASRTHWVAARTTPPQTRACHWSVFGKTVLLWSDATRSAALDELRSTMQREGTVHTGTCDGTLHLIAQVGRSFEREHPNVPLLLRRGRYLVASLDQATLARLREDTRHACWSMRPLEPYSTVYTDVERRPGVRTTQVDDLVAQVSAARLRSHLEHLTAYGTRHSFSSQFAAAADWARLQLAALGLLARVEPIQVPPSGAALNVIADLLGNASGARNLVLITAHLDSINSTDGASAPAPGSDDNASGVAGALEVARVLAGIGRSHDLRIVLFGGEEQGLHGSRQYVAALDATERARIRAVINMDMIATINGSERGVLLEGAGVSVTLLDALAAAAASYTDLSVQSSLNPFASDHVPFIDAGIPAVLTIERADADNANVHTSGDTLNHIDDGLMRDIVKVNVAAIATYLVTQPQRPVVSGPAVSWGSDRVDAFMLGTDSAAHHKWNAGGSWGPSSSGFAALGGTLCSPVEAVSWAPNRLDLFAIGTRSELLHKWGNGSSWGPSTSGWESLGGVCTSRPKAVAWGPDRLDVFLLGTNSALHHKWWNGSSWGPSISDFESLGGTCIGNPEAVAWGPNRLDVFVLGTDRRVYHKAWNGSAWAPSLTGFESLGGTLISDIKAVAWGPNRLDLFAIGTDRKLYHKAWNGSAWLPSISGWESLGGTCMGELAAVSWGSDRLDVFVLGTDRKLYHKAWNGSAWAPSVTDFESLGGTCMSGPFVASSAPNRIDVFVTGTDSALYHKGWNGSAWTGFTKLGGVILPRATSADASLPTAQIVGA